MSYNNQGPKKLWASGVTKTLHFNQEQDPRTGKPRKEKLKNGYEWDITEELAFSIKPEDVAEFIGRMQDAAANQQGTGGVRFSLYGNRMQSKQGGGEYDAISVNIYEQKPQQNFQRGGGAFRGQAQGGRTNYPPRTAPGPVQGGYGGYRQGNGAPQDMPAEPAPEPQQPQRGGVTPRGQAAPRTASPSSPNAQGRTSAPPTASRGAAAASTRNNPPQPQAVDQGPAVPEDCPI